MNQIKYISSILFLTTFAVQAGIFSASNYEDCILDGVKDAKSDSAIAAIYQMCERKFPTKVKKRIDLPQRAKFVCDLSQYNRTDLYDFSYDLTEKSIELNGRKYSIFRITENDLYVNLTKDGDVLIFNLIINQLTIKSGKNPSTAFSIPCAKSR